MHAPLTREHFKTEGKYFTREEMYDHARARG